MQKKQLYVHLSNIEAIQSALSNKQMHWNQEVAEYNEVNKGEGEKLINKATIKQNLSFVFKVVQTR